MKTRTATTTAIAALLPLAAVALYLRARWDDLPLRYPRHWDAAGVANGWGTRSAASVYFPVLVGVCAVLLIALSIAGVTRLRQRGTPMSGRMQHLVTTPMLLMAWLMALLFCLLALMPLMPLPNPKTFLAVALTFIVLNFAIILPYAVQAARQQRLEAITGTGSALPSYDASHWRAGVFYYNPADSSVFVPKRYGIGWTVNFARPVVWAITSVVLCLIFAPLVLSIFDK